MGQNEQSGDRLRVIGICGSLRPGSYTRMAVQAALEGAREAGALTRLLDLRDYRLVWCDGHGDQRTLPEDVFRLRREVSQAQGIILGTPEYHGSFSGLLKNALDLMGFEEVEGKVIGLVGVSGGALGAACALDGLRTVARALHAWVVPEQASIPHAYRAFDGSGALKDGDLEKRVKAVGRQVARFARLHALEKVEQLAGACEAAPINPAAVAG